VGLNTLSVKFRVVSLTMAALLQLCAIVVDQIVIQIDGKIESNKFEVEEHQLVLDDLSFRIRMVTKEWQHLRSSVDLLLLKSDLAGTDIEAQVVFSTFLLNLSVSSLGTLESELIESQLIKIKNIQKALAQTIEQPKPISDALIEIDISLIDISNILRECEELVISHNYKLNSTLSSSVNQRHLLMLTGVILQILSLFMLLLFLTSEYKNKHKI